MFLFSVSLISDGNEFDNPFMAFGAFLAMTFLIHFPIVWIVVNVFIKKILEK